MKAFEQFHVGIVVDDFETTLMELSELFGYEWCQKIRRPTAVNLPTGDAVIDLRFAYSVTQPRLEIIHSIPGTVWAPAAGSGIHHIGYWSDDVAADSAEFARRGYTLEASGIRPDGTQYWAYHRSVTGPRIELVDRTIQPDLEQYWTTAGAP
jgi:Glyoxalase/Bleomycin resistance protein/Dioxygenase superfamily